jgi:hypothetical protein
MWILKALKGFPKTQNLPKNIYQLNSLGSCQSKFSCTTLVNNLEMGIQRKGLSDLAKEGIKIFLQNPSSQQRDMGMQRKDFWTWPR